MGGFDVILISSDKGVPTLLQCRIGDMEAVLTLITLINQRGVGTWMLFPSVSSLSRRVVLEG
jgi:hypothetical protein